MERQFFTEVLPCPPISFRQSNAFKCWILASKNSPCVSQIEKNASDSRHATWRCLKQHQFSIFWVTWVSTFCVAINARLPWSAAIAMRSRGPLPPLPRRVRPSASSAATAELSASSRKIWDAICLLDHLLENLHRFFFFLWFLGFGGHRKELGPGKTMKGGYVITRYYEIFYINILKLHSQSQNYAKDSNINMFLCAAFHKLPCWRFASGQEEFVNVFGTSIKCLQPIASSPWHMTDKSKKTLVLSLLSHFSIPFDGQLNWSDWNFLVPKVPLRGKYLLPTSKICQHMGRCVRNSPNGCWFCLNMGNPRWMAWDLIPNDSVYDPRHGNYSKLLYMIFTQPTVWVGILQLT